MLRETGRVERGQPTNRFVLLAVLALVCGGLLVLVSFMAGRSSTSSRHPCATNLRMIGQAITLYVAEHRVWPDTLQTLVAATPLARERLRCPDAALSNDSYVFLVRSGSSTRPASSEVIACDRAGNHANGGFILLADGSVRFIEKGHSMEVPEAAR